MVIKITHTYSISMSLNNISSYWHVISPSKPSPGILNGTGEECDKFFFYVSLVYFPEFEDMFKLIASYFNNNDEYYYAIMLDSIYGSTIYLYTIF